MSTNTTADLDSATRKAVESVDKQIKVAWGAGALGVSVLMNSVSFLVMFYMVGVLHIEPALAGTLIFATKLLDVVSDPVVGIWSDRITSRMGRRRPFLIPGAILSAIALALIFTTPVFENQVFTATYIFCALLIYTIGYTVFNVPYMAMPAEMTDSYHERSSIHAYRVVFVTIGSFLASSVAPWTLEALGKAEWSSYAILGSCGSLVVLSSMLVTFFGTGRARHLPSGAAIPDIRADLRAVVANGYFLRLAGVKACQLLGVAASSSAMVFFIVNTLQLNMKVMSYFYALVMLVSIATAPLVVKLSRIIGKRSAYMVIGTCYVIYAASWNLAVPGEHIALMLGRAVILGVCITGNILLAMSMLTDTIEFDARRTGVQRAGVYTALYSFIEKTTYAFGPLVVGVALSLAGFDRNLPVDELQSPAVRNALLLGVSYLPAVLGIGAVWILYGYRLDEAALNATKREGARG